MGILTSAFQVIQDDIYNHVPPISCQACGKCCVSPHMTLIEFCYVMIPLLEKPAVLEETISRVVPYHPDFPGQFMCRFQTPDKLCGVYAYRPLACRLHGHPILKEVGLEYQLPCDLARPVQGTLTADDVYNLMDRITELNQGYYSYYTPPYWISGLNTEVWLTVLFDDVPWPVFRLLRKLIERELNIGRLADMYTQRIELGGKLTLIDEFQEKLPFGRADTLCPLLEKIQNDFPDTGAYYYYEAEMYKEELKKRTSVLTVL